MPAPRAPYVLLWAGVTAHPKVATLSDGVFRTWVELLVAGCRQKRRWHFASVVHAARVVARPKRHVLKLIEARLIDVVDDGIYMHDAHKWQNVAHPMRAEWNSLRAKIAPTMYAEASECGECGAVDDLTVDHIIPLARGGTNDIENLAVLCRPCNSRKGTTIWPG